MPRQARPRWVSSSQRWVANIGERGRDGRAREVYAPPSLGKRDEAAAWDWLRAELGKREAVPTRAGEPTTNEVAEGYLAWADARRMEGRLSEQHYINKCRHLGIWLDHVDKRAASSLSADEMTAWLEELVSDGRARAYVRNIRASVNAALNWGARTKLLPSNPVRGSEAPTVPRTSERFAEKAEAAAFLRFLWRQRPRDASRSPYDRSLTLMVRTMVRTGARPGELCRLRWSDLRWEAWATSAGHCGAKAVLGFDRHKTGKATGKPRVIYLTPSLARAFRRAHDHPLHHEHVFAHGPGRGGLGAGEPWASGSVLSKTIAATRRRLIREQVELRERIEAGDETVKPWERRLAAVPIQDTGDNRLTNYRWRHTAISTLLMLGVDVPTVAELVGTSPDMVYRTYGHLLDSHLAAAAARLAGGRR
jgi:integrase